MLKLIASSLLTVSTSFLLPSAVQAGFVRIQGSGFSVQLGTPSFPPYYHRPTVPAFPHHYHSPTIPVVPRFHSYPVPVAPVGVRCPYTSRIIVAPPNSVIVAPSGAVIQTPNVVITPRGMVIQESTSTLQIHQHPYTSF
ncbi:MAG: hypothetical protein ACK4QL_08640 [Pseudanabaenaceae cyanobacterium]